MRKQDLPPVVGPDTNPPKQTKGRKTTTMVLAIEERRAKATQLKLDGYSYDEIGAELGIDGSTAHSDVMTVLARTMTIANDNWIAEREFTRQRAERCIKALMPEALMGDVKSSLAVRLWEETRIKVLGLDRGDDGPAGGENTERDLRIIRMLAHPGEKMRELLTQAIKTQGSTLLRVIKELVKNMPIDTTAETVE